MANDDARRGLVPVGHRNGNNVVVEYFPVAAAASSIFKGDLVVATSGGHVESWLESGAGNDPVGVAVERFTTGSAATIGVITDPDVIYEIQADSAGTVGLTNIFNKFGLVTATPSSLNQSVYELDASSAAASDTSGTKPLTLIGFSKRINQDGTANTRGASHAKCLVVINKSIFKAQTPSA